MKKFISCIALLALSLSIFAGCTPKENSETTTEPATVEVTEAVSNLTAAKEYLYTMYKDAQEATPADYTVVGVVAIGTESYEVEWTADSDTVKIVRGEDKMVTIDVDEKNPEEVSYKLTATVTDADGKTESVSFAHRVPAAIIIDEGMSYEEIVEAAYKLEADLAMPEEYRLYGVITEINDAYSEKYDNITVTIQIGELADKPIKCFRLSGEGVADLAVGDDITVAGTLKNYKGEIEFDKGCRFLGKGEHVDQSKTLEAAYGLEDGLSMPAPVALTGVITEAEEWSEKYSNITVTMVVDGVEDKPIMCFRLTGAGADKLAVGDTITVVGTIKNYKGTIEFDQGCKLIPAEARKDALTAMAAYGLEEDLAMNEPATMTGVLTEINDEFSEKYNNITVTMVVGGMDDYKIKCFRLSGEGAAELAVGDTITVTGTLKNYKGEIEFDKGCTLDAVVKAEA